MSEEEERTSNAGRKNTDKSVSHRRALVARMYLEGRYQSDIARMFGVDQSQISKDIKAIKEEWVASRLRDFDAMIEVQLEKIDLLESEYWDAWKDSRKTRTRNTLKTKRKQTPTDQILESIEAGDEAEGEIEIEETTTEVLGSGDPRFLDGIQKCIERRCKLLGLDVIGYGGADKDEEEYNVIILPDNNRQVKNITK